MYTIQTCTVSHHFMQSHIRRVRVTWVINDIVYSDIGQEHHEATCVMNSISIIQSVSHSFTRSINQSVNLLNVTRRAMTTVMETKT